MRVEGSKKRGGGRTEGTCVQERSGCNFAIALKDCTRRRRDRQAGVVREESKVAQVFNVYGASGLEPDRTRDKSLRNECVALDRRKDRQFSVTARKRYERMDDEDTRVQ